jgi:tRNA nucleotidyltransferase (CCA-adding enzyme)
MKKYLVGGAVRDQLLGLPVTDRDWLVTDSTPERLAALGYQQVGRDFPVFLDPVTKEEHALPRAGKNLPEAEQVIQDLLHRDLTINAMALNQNKRLIDPLNGRSDLEKRLLRHTPAFFDDPIRTLRLARFAARYAGLGFTIAQETIDAVQRQIAHGLLDGLVPERAWGEIQRALEGDRPSRFFQALRELNALGVILPEVERLFGVPQPEKYHPEIDTGIHVLMVLDRACALSTDPVVRFAALVHDLGKGTTPPDQWPRHTAHEARGVKLVDRLCKRLKIPNPYHTLARLVCEYHTHSHRAEELKPGTLLKLLNALDCFRRPQRLEDFLIACQADMQGRTGFEQAPYPQAAYLRQIYQAASGVDPGSLIDPSMDGNAIRKKLEHARTLAITQAKKAWNNH